MSRFWPKFAHLPRHTCCSFLLVPWPVHLAMQRRQTRLGARSSPCRRLRRAVECGWCQPRYTKTSFRLPRLLAFDGIWGHQDGCLRRMRSRRCLFLQVHLSIWSCTCNIMITNVGFFEDLVNDHNTNAIIKLHLCVLRASPEPLK